MTREQFTALVELVGHLHDEAERCAEVKAWRAALVLLGGELEAGLLAMAGALEEDLKRDGHWRKERELLWWSLGDLIELAIAAGWLTSALPTEAEAGNPATLLEGKAGDAIKFVRQLRDTFAHPARHVRELEFLDADDEEVMRPTYEVARGVVDTVFAELVQVWERVP